MSKIRMIFIETALVAGVLIAGIAATSSAKAATVFVTLQAASKAPAADPRASVTIKSKILVERTEQGGTKLHAPKDVKVVPGDKLVFINSYRNTSSDSIAGFVVNNPVHPAVTFSGVTQDWAIVSVDGGKNFGKLTALSITEAVPVTEDADTGVDSVSPATQMATRPAQPSDVTHIRWAFAQPIAAGASGKLEFRGTVK